MKLLFMDDAGSQDVEAAILLQVLASDYTMQVWDYT